MRLLIVNLIPKLNEILIQFSDTHSQADEPEDSETSNALESAEPPFIIQAREILAEAKEETPTILIFMPLRAGS